MTDPNINLLDSLPQPGWLWSADGTFLAGNAALRQVLGGLPEKGDTWPDLPNREAQLAGLADGQSVVIRSFLHLPGFDGQSEELPVDLRIIRRAHTYLGVMAIDPVGKADATTRRWEPMENLRCATSAAGLALFTIDPASQEIEGNAAFHRLLDTPPMQRLVRKDLIDCVHPDDRDTLTPRFAALTARQSPRMDVEIKVRAQEDDWRWMRLAAQARDRSHVGLPPLICGCVWDISDAMAREDQLRQALAETRTTRDAIDRAREETRKMSELFRISVANGQIGPFSVCPETGEYWMMDETFRMMGYEPGAFVPDISTRMALIHPEDRAMARARTEQLFRGEIDVYDHDSRQRHADGSYHWYRTICSAVDRSAQGLPTLYAGVTTRIDALKEDQERLTRALLSAKQTSERLNRLADGAPTALYEVSASPDGKIEIPFFSAKMLDLFAVTAEELQGDPFVTQRAMNPKDILRLERAIEKAHTDLKPFEITVELEHPDRGQTWLQIASNPHRQANGSVRSFASVTDITQQVEAERQIALAATQAQQAHERLNLMAENAPVALFEFQQAADGSVSLPYFNLQLADLFGIDVDELRQDGTTIFTHVHPDDQARMQAAIDASAKDLTTFELQFRILHPDRGLLRVLSRSAPHRDLDGGTRWYGSSFDLTERLELERKTREAAEELKQAHARLGALADAAPVGIFELERLADGTFRYAYASRRFKEIAGVTDGSGAEMRKQVHANVHPDDRESLDLARAAAISHDGIHEHRFRLIHPEQGERWIAASVVASKRGNLDVLTGAYVDVTDDVRREEDIRRARDMAEQMRRRNELQALHDPLTELPNRRYFEQELASRFTLARSDPDTETIVLIRVDCDRFKYVNDTFGHGAGDAVLQRISAILRSHGTEGSFPARIGGDEFSIIAPLGSDETDATVQVEAIRKAMAAPLDFDGRKCRIQASFGIASVNAAVETSTDLMAYADAALYQAKDAGRNRLELFTPTLRAAINETRRLAVELQDALARDEFEPYYQVQVDTQRGCLAGVEALLRWNHPERGVLAPGAFMRVAEQLRIVPDLDRLVIGKARADLAKLRRKGIHVPKISLNVSAGRMRDVDVVSTARDLVQDGVRVTFELLESTLVEEADDVFKFNLDLLRDSGIEIEIDDFGSGHASIIALMAIEPSVLKIDRRLLIEVAESARDQKLVRAIVEIAETLNIGVIAEGVETREQVDMLRQLGCHIVQGYHFSRPIPLPQFETLLRNPTWAENGQSDVA